jgi:Na+-driven multidrug efflux pump
MTLRYLLVTTAVLSFIFGLGYLLMPDQVLALFGTATDDVGLLAARFFGGAVVGYGVLALAHRDSNLLEARGSVVPAFAISFTLGFVLALVGQLSGLLNALGWVSVVTFLLLAIGYAYVQFGRPI